MPELDAQTPVASSATPDLAPRTGDAAVLTGDQSTFKAQRSAERAGKPLDAIAASSPALVEESSPAGTPASPVAASEPAKGRNAKARTAELDRDIADLNERLRVRALLRDELAKTEPKPSVTPASPAAAPTIPDHKRYAALPNAPKIEQFESIEEYTAAFSLFVADQRYEEREQAKQRDADTQRQQSEHIERQTRHEQSARTFAERLSAAVANDPELPRIEQFADPAQYQAAFVSHLVEQHGIDPRVLGYKPSALRQGKEPLTVGHLVADGILRSTHPMQLLKHLSDPTEQERINALGTPEDVTYELARIEAGFESESAPAPKHVTSAPAPPTTLGKRPAIPVDALDAAVQSGDQGAYKRARMQQRAAAFR